MDGGAAQDNNDDTVAEPVQGPEEELPTEQPVRQTINVKPLNEKAVLVTLKRGMYRPYISDVNATEEYGVGTVNKHLFDGRDNLVKRAVAKFTAVYIRQRQHSPVGSWTTYVEHDELDRVYQ